MTVTFPRLKLATLCLALALLPIVTTLPLWIIATVVAAAILRLWLSRTGRNPPPAALRLTLAALAIGLLLVQFHSFSGVTAGTALLALMAGLKLLETRSNRDLHVILFIVYFLSLAALLRANSFWLLNYLVLLAWLTTAGLLQLTTAGGGPGWRAAARHSGRIMLHALPLALCLWLLFPRFNAPLWQFGEDGGGAVSGLGDTMNPGGISDLALSDEIAFRVRFAGDAPPSQELYWRGPVLDAFDGDTWRRADREYATPPPLAVRGPEYRYTITIEPHRHPWIFALDLPARWDLPNARLTGDYVLVQPQPVSKPVDVAATSFTNAGIVGVLPEAQRRRDSDASTGNPRTQEFAARLRREHPDDGDYAQAVLSMLHTEAYYYTLTPPRLGADPVDEFLFDTKRGFCGHYASAFALLMRAAGIPARIVTGYLGGTLNPYGNYWIVRQADAHAWVEIWIAGRGWQRVDPTAAIAPARVLRSPRNEVQGTELLGVRLPVRVPWLIDFALRADALRQAWRERILRFDQTSQQHLLQRLLIPEPDAGKLVLVLSCALALVFGWLTWQVRRELRGGGADALGRAYADLTVRFKKAGLARLPFEGSEAHAARIAVLRPDLQQAAQALARRYSDLRYGAATPTPAAIRRFRKDVRAFKPGFKPRDFPASA